MQTKPFSIQSPESIATEYGGNKQKIASAAQMGLLDPTAAVLAGMFIDRMRSAAIQEKAPTSTVAQQVLGKAPPAPPMAAPAPAPVAPGGLGSIPTPAMAAPQQSAPPPPQGMADGGIVNIPIPDAMFDEPDNGGYNDGYANGGIVAFADGGAAPVDPLWYLHARVNPRGTFGLQRRNEVHKGDDFPIPTGTPVGSVWPGTVVASGTNPSMGNFVRVKGPTGQVATYMHLSALNVNPGDTVDKGQLIGKTGSTGHSTGPHLHFEVRNPDHTAIDPLAAASAFNKNPMMANGAPAAVRPDPSILGSTATPAAPRLAAPNFLDLISKYQGAVGANSPETTQRQAMLADLTKQISPEEVAKDKKHDMWAALAQMGFGMASSKSPHFLQALSEGAQQALPQMQASAKERKADARANRQAMLSLENMSNEDKQKAFALAAELAKADAGLLTDAEKLQLQAYVAQLDTSTQKLIEAMRVQSQNYSTDIGAGTARDVANINSASRENTGEMGLFGKTNDALTRMVTAGLKANATVPGAGGLNPLGQPVNPVTQQQPIPTGQQQGWNIQPLDTQ